MICFGEDHEIVATYVAFKMKAVTVQEAIEDFERRRKKSGSPDNGWVWIHDQRNGGQRSRGGCNQNGDWSGRLNHAPMVGVDLAIAPVFVSLIILLMVVRRRWHNSPAEQANNDLIGENLRCA